jgi:hypothetical protein
MGRPHQRRTAPLIAVALALLGLAGAMAQAGVGLGVAGAPAGGVAGRDAGIAASVASVADRVADRAGDDVPSVVPAGVDLPRWAVRGGGPVLIAAGALLAALGSVRVRPVPTAPIAGPVPSVAHVRRRGPPSLVV